MVTPTLPKRKSAFSQRSLATMIRLSKKRIAVLFFVGIFVVLLISGTTHQSEFDEYYDHYEAVASLAGQNHKCPDTRTKAAIAASATSIVEKNDPQLHKTATVMAMATGYSLNDYQKFVGSLRKTGFMGNIILVVSPKIKKKEESYLLEKNVTLHKVQFVNCTHAVGDIVGQRKKLNPHQKELVTCVHPFPELKHRWARFPLLRDLLDQCGGRPNPEIQCGGPVLITDMRDTFFQRNPFGPDAPKVTGLQVFEEHYTIRTTHWIVKGPVWKCKNKMFDEPMLCSGTTIGTRQAMLDYLEIFHKEMNSWMESPDCCCFEMNGDDQSMHNYMYYSGMLNNVTGGVVSVKNRNGLVNTVGAIGSLIRVTHKQEKDNLWRAIHHQNPDKGLGHKFYKFDLAETEEKDTKNWLGLHYGLTDTDGYFVQFDGSRSYVVHQYDRFGAAIKQWLRANAKHLYLP